MNHLFDEILEFQFKIPFIFRLKKSTISYYVLLYPPCYILTLSRMHIYKFYARNICTSAKYSQWSTVYSSQHWTIPSCLRNELGFSKRVTSTWLYTRIRSKREVFHWRESGGGWRWRTAAMIIITGHWGCARVEGCIVSGRGHRWQAPRFQRGAPRPTLQLDRYFPVP